MSTKLSRRRRKNRYVRWVEQDSSSDETFDEVNDKSCSERYDEDKIISIGDISDDDKPSSSGVTSSRTINSGDGKKSCRDGMLDNEGEKNSDDEMADLNIGVHKLATEPPLSQVGTGQSSESRDMTSIFRHLFKLDDKLELPADPTTFQPYMEMVNSMIAKERIYTFPEYKYVTRLTEAFCAALMLAKLTYVTLGTLSTAHMKSLQDTLVDPLDIFGLRIWYSKADERFHFFLDAENRDVKRTLCKPDKETEICLAYTRNNFKLCQAHYLTQRKLQSDEIWNHIKTLLKIKNAEGLTEEKYVELKLELKKKTNGESLINSLYVLCLKKDRLATRNINQSSKIMLCINYLDGCFRHVEPGFDDCMECEADRGYFVFVARDETNRSKFHISRTSTRLGSDDEVGLHARARCASERKDFTANDFTTYDSVTTKKNDFIQLATLRIYCQFERVIRKHENLQVNYAGWMHGNKRKILHNLIDLGKEHNVKIEVVDVPKEEAEKVRPKYFTLSQDDDYIKDNFGNIIYEFYMDSWCYVGEKHVTNFDRHSKYAACHDDISTDSTAVGKKIRNMRDSGEVTPTFYPPCRVLAHCNTNATVLTVENLFILSRIFLSSDLLGTSEWYRENINLQMMADDELPYDWLEDVNAILMRCAHKKIVITPGDEAEYILE